MRDEYDLLQATRAKEVPHLARLQEEAKGKTRITVMLDNDVLMAFRARVNAEAIRYQTLINQALRETLGVGGAASR
jgi:uncharacterized protein (DUF4415 family)